MPKIAEIDATPNPNAKKFILKEPLTWGVSRSYDDAEQAKDDALAAQLFAIDHVTNVFYVDHWITVTQDGGADWPELLRKLAEPIRNAPSAEVQSQQYAAADYAPSSEQMTPEEQERFARISEMLDEQVRPYLQGDGGDLYVVGLKGNVLEVHYQGACGSCPSSLSGTLAGIENMLRSMEPDIEVIAV
jgi:Fe-S cluster biogenesis protein NfuA